MSPESHSLAPGSRFGALEILGPLGAGGMGLVYRAHDPRLSRTIALKILPQPSSADADRIARFDREARTLAALNHPNIAQIYGVEEADGVRALVMELVEGVDLSQRIAAGPLPVEEALSAARQIADALEAAHELGIVHRDLKPANIRLRADGVVKVLDFGLAKIFDPASNSSDSMSTLMNPALTAQGIILGTAAYMAPEQARGRPVDKRADIWAFGVVLYEMLTGTRLFSGDSVADIIAQVVSRDPDVSALPASLPPRLVTLLHRCLQRDPRQRLRDIGEGRIALDPSTELVSSPPQTRAATRSPRARAVHVAAAASVLAAAAAMGWVTGRRGAVTDPGFSTFMQLTNQAGEETAPAISPDGNSIAYAVRSKGTWDVYVQRVGGRNAIPIAADPNRNESGPAFSPDGLKIAFHEGDRDGGIFAAGATGESARRLTDFGFDAAWSADGTHIVFATEEANDPYTRHSISALWSVPAGGDAPPRKISDGDAMQPSWSPSGARIAYWRITGGQRDLYTMAADGSDVRPVFEDPAVDWSPTWSSNGQHLYFASDRGGSMNVWRVAIAEATGHALSQAEPITKGVYASADRPSLSKDGSRIVFRSEIRNVNPVAVSFDPDTERIGPIRTLIRANDVLTPTGISPDGQWLLLSSQSGRRDDIFICRSDGSELRRVTDDVFRDRWPRFSQNGNEIIFYSNRTGRFEIFGIKVDGSGLRKISEQPGINIHFPTLSPSGNRLVASTQMSPDAWVADPALPWAPGNAQKLEGLGTAEEWLIPIHWSPDGQRLAGPVMSRAGTIKAVGVYAFESGASGRIVMRNDIGDSYQVSWLADNRRLVVIDRSHRIHIVDTQTGTHRTVFADPAWRFWGNVPPISQDGRTLYLGALDSQSDVWMVTTAAAR